MGFLIFSLILTAVIIEVPVCGQCPISCDYKRYTRNECYNETVTCYKRSFKNEECKAGPRANMIHNTTTEVYIQDCTIKNLTYTTFSKEHGIPITKLFLQKVRVESVSEDVFKYLPMLREFTLSDCYSVDMARLGSAMKHMKNNHGISVSLTGLRFMNDNITVIFTGYANIKNISLANNTIEHLPLLELQHERSLEVLDLSNNKISNISLPTKNIENLKHLSLKNNRVKEIEHSIWQELEGRLPKLEILDLRENAIENLKSIISSVFPAIKSLNLAGNHIKYLDFNILQTFSHTEELDLSSNWLSDKSHSNVMIRSVKRLSLRDNQFAKFPPWLCNNDRDDTAYFPNLEILDLSKNLIQFTITQSWKCLTQLKELNMSNNPLKEIRNNTFANLTSLEVLDLSMLHGLEIVEPDAFNITNLKDLNFESSDILCSINQSSTNIFQHLTNLQVLNLADNKFPDLNDSETTTLLSPLSSIKHLTLSHVGISHLPFNLLTLFPHLKTLYLDDNHFQTRHLHVSFSNANRLEYLSLVRNRISVIRKEYFKDMNKRTTMEIDLSGNTLACQCHNRWFREEFEDGRGRVGGIKYRNWETYKCSSLSNEAPKLFKDYHPTNWECGHLSEMITAYIPIACFALVCSITSGLVYKFRWHITYWKYKMKRKRSGKKDPEQLPLMETLKFDAYIIYRIDDPSPNLDKFIVREFEPMVKDLGYKCFIWDRDAGCGAKISIMGDGIYESRNVIAIVSSSFLRDPWCNFQVKVALERQVNLQRQTLMFIVLEDVDFQLLNKRWCVRFTKNPTANWCSNRDDIKRRVLESKLVDTLGKPGQLLNNAKKERQGDN